jgi:hypothetical protein
MIFKRQKPFLNDEGKAVSCDHLVSRPVALLESQGGEQQVAESEF